MLVFALLFEHQAILSRVAGPPEQQYPTAHFRFSRPFADPEGGGAGGPDPHPEKSQKYRVSFQYWSGSHVGPAKRHLNEVSLAGR